MAYADRFQNICLLTACMAVAMPSWSQTAPPVVSAKVAKSKSLLVGPMAGAVTMRSARIWLQLQSLPQGQDVPVWLEYQQDEQDGISNSPIMRSSSAQLNGARQTTVVHLDELKPGTRYRYRVRWGHARAPQSSAWQTLVTESLWQWRTDPPALRVLAGSCSYTNDPVSDRPGQPYGQSTGIYGVMAQRSPDITLWMGDNIYLRETDFDDRKAMAQRYDQWRATPELQPLLQKGRHLATWDDHDYGPNDSNAANVTKDLSLELFKQYWANPTYGLPDLPGVFTQTRASDVEFFFLDGRWYRDSDKRVDDDRAMLGAGQLRWLKNALTASTATWKLVISGSQILNLNNNFEGWHKFPKEHQAFLTWLEQQNIPGVLLMSGDRHFSTLLKLDRPGHYPLYELTCSPMTARAYQSPTGDLKNNSRIVDNTVVTQNNFCELEFMGPKGQRVMTLSISDSRGNRLWERRLSEQELKSP